MGFNFKRALRNATIMAMMEEEQKSKEVSLENFDMQCLEDEDLDFDELQEMSEKKRDKILRKHGLDPDDYDFEN